MLVPYKNTEQSQTIHHLLRGPNKYDMSKEEINIIDIYKQKKEDKIRKNKNFDIVLKKCYDKIKMAVRLNKWDLIWRVPEFVPGLALYNYNHCIAYIMSNLQSKGFVLIFKPPGTIVISWRPEEVKYYGTIRNLEDMSMISDNQKYLKNYDEKYDLNQLNTVPMEQHMQNKNTMQPLPPVPLNNKHSQYIHDNAASNGVYEQTNYSYIPRDELSQNQSSQIPNMNKTYEPPETFLKYTHQQNNNNPNIIHPITETSQTKHMSFNMNNINNMNYNKRPSNYYPSAPLAQSTPIHDMPSQKQPFYNPIEKVLHNENEHNRSLAEASKIIHKHDSIHNPNNGNKHHRMSKVESHYSGKDLDNFLLNKDFRDKKNIKL